MQRFSYRAKDKKGQSRTGVVEARDQKEAVSLLREKNLFIIHMGRATSGSLSGFSNYFNRISFNDIVNLTRQLSTMITAGLTLSEALSILRMQVKNPSLVLVISQIQEDVQGGKSFSDSIEKYPQHFSPIYRALVRAGEASGKLDEVLERLSENLEKAREFRSKTRGAFIYPTIILVGMVIVMFIMMTFVVPRLTTIYQDFGVELPTPTVILIAISTFLSNFWYLVIGGIILLIVLFRRWKKTPVGQRVWDKFLLGLPILGNLIKEATLVEVTRTLSILVGAGIPILEAISISRGAVANVHYQDSLAEIEIKVEKGFSLGNLFSDNPLFPPILGMMVVVGEQTGKLDDSLFKLSRYFESETENAVKALTTLMEPLIMVILGVGVGFLVLAVLMPIYSLTSQF
ncbi:type II secretion system F family protein [Candidatus Gottesmanbacteria bacterium]|nr:type II secretion system F family protein [Candidatus Gottesmanbacteria bacterium]